MIVLPLFWDQYDNAQRIHETGFGVRLDTYRFSDDELTGAVDRLLANSELGRGWPTAPPRSSPARVRPAQRT